MLWGSGCHLWLGRIWRIRSTLGEKPSWGEVGNPLLKDMVWKFTSTLGDKEPWGVSGYPRVRDAQGLRSQTLVRDTWRWSP